jgi:hypothetical protein
MSLALNLKRTFSLAKYGFLKDLDLDKENYGAYFNGKWQGTG